MFLSAGLVHVVETELSVRAAECVCAIDVTYFVCLRSDLNATLTFGDAVCTNMNSHGAGCNACLNMLLCVFLLPADFIIVTMSTVGTETGVRFVFCCTKC